MHGRQTEDKALIVVAAEEDGRGIGRIRLRHIRDASSSSLIPFVKDSIEPGNTVHTDGWLGYLPLEAYHYRHRITYLKDHAVQHLQDYLDEFAFHFNRRKSRSRGKLFYRLTQQAVAMEPTTYRQIVDSPRPQPRT